MSVFVGSVWETPENSFGLVRALWRVDSAEKTEANQWCAYGRDGEVCAWTYLITGTYLDGPEPQSINKAFPVTICSHWTLKETPFQTFVREVLNGANAG